MLHSCTDQISILTCMLIPLIDRFKFSFRLFHMSQTYCVLFFRTTFSTRSNNTSTTRKPLSSSKDHCISYRKVRRSNRSSTAYRTVQESNQQSAVDSRASAQLDALRNDVTALNAAVTKSAPLAQEMSVRHKFHAPMSTLPAVHRSTAQPKLLDIRDCQGARNKL